MRQLLLGFAFPFCVRGAEQCIKTFIKTRYRNLVNQRGAEELRRRDFAEKCTLVVSSDDEIAVVFGYARLPENNVEFRHVIHDFRNHERPLCALR